MPKLRNLRHEKFAQGLVAGMKGAEAMAAAGMKPNRKTASILRRRPDVDRRIAELVEAGRVAEERATATALERHCVTKERIIRELAVVAFANMGDYASWRDHAVELVDSASLPAVDRAAVQHVEEGRAKDGSPIVKLKLHDKLRALELLARILKLLRYVDLKDGGAPDNEPLIPLSIVEEVLKARSA